MKKIKDALYEYIERNSNSENENGEKAQGENIQNENAQNGNMPNNYANIGLGMDNLILKGRIEKVYNPNGNIEINENRTPNQEQFQRIKNAILERDKQNEIKMKNRADILYGNDIEYYQKYYPEKFTYTFEPNPDYKPIHDTYRKISIDANTYAGKANIDGFKPCYTDFNHKTGFYGRAYINEETKTVVIAYKGSDEKSLKDWGDNNFKMWINREMPAQFEDAEKFYFDVLNILGNQAPNYKVDFTGYSLGATLSDLMGAKYGNETVSFNPFGIGQMQDAVINHRGNITNYGHINDKVYNWKNTWHVGKNIRTSNIGGKNAIYDNHQLENLGDLHFRIKENN